MNKQTRQLSNRYQGKQGWIRYTVSGGKVVAEVLSGSNAIDAKLRDIATADELDKINRHQILPSRILADHNFIRVDDIGSYIRKGDARSKKAAEQEAPNELRVRPIGYVLFDYSVNTIPYINGAPLVSRERGELIRWLRSEQFATNAGKNSALKDNHLANHELGVKMLVESHTPNWTHILDLKKTAVYDSSLD